MISKLDTKWCVNGDVGPNEVDCEIPHWLERKAKHFFIKVCKSLSLLDVF